MSQLSHNKFNLDWDYAFTNDIKKTDYLRVYLSASSVTNLNKAGNTIFENKQSSNPLDICNALLYYKINVEPVVVLPATEAVKDITLENNWFPRLFSQMSLKLGTSEVENIQYPGEVSTMLNFALTDDAYKEESGTLSGWVPDIATGDTSDKNPSYATRKNLYNKGFEGKFPLKNLFGFLQCYGRVIFNIPLSLTLNREINNENIFYGVAKSAAKIKFEELELWIPEIRLNPALEVKLLERLNIDKPIKVSYLYRQSAMISDLSNGPTHTWKVATLSERPRYMFIGFKTAASSFQTNNSLFIQKSGDAQIKSIRVQLNSTYYPNDPLTFDSTKNYQMQPYENYIEMCKHFGNNPQLNYKDFKDLHSIFCFDFSAQDEKLVSNGCDVNIHITKDSAFQAKCYCLILKEQHSTINLKNGNMYLFS